MTIKDAIVYYYLILLLLASITLHGQTDTVTEQILEERMETDRKFKDPDISPLTKKDRRKFKHLRYFPVDTAYRVRAKLVQHEQQDTFEMKTTTTRLPVYVKWGELHFSINNRPLILQLYQNVELSKKEEYADQLFLPFLDETSGIESYGGGRYLDIKIPALGDIVTLDFNRAYNPYCAYNKKYSCPLVPYENRLPVKIEAGVLTFH